jgi:parvulin-like peptidyl-prolyl isomerase
MRKLPLAIAIASFLLALIVFAFAGGARSIYSGLFFVMVGVVLLVNARRSERRTPE